MDGLARVVEPNTADATERMFQDISQTDLDFLRDAFTTLRGRWVVTLEEDNLEPPAFDFSSNYAMVLPYDDVDEVPAFNIMKWASGGFHVAVVWMQTPANDPSDGVVINDADSISDAFRAIAQFLFDPIARPTINEVTLTLGRQHSYESGTFEEVPIKCEANHGPRGWTVRSDDLRDRPVGPRDTLEEALGDYARSRGGPLWQGGFGVALVEVAHQWRFTESLDQPAEYALAARRNGDQWEGAAGRPHEGVTWGPPAATIEGAMLAAWDRESASRAAMWLPKAA